MKTFLMQHNDKIIGIQKGMLHVIMDNNIARLNISKTRVPFDLARAKEGVRFQTRDGHSAGVLSFDGGSHPDFPLIIGVIFGSKVNVLTFSTEGRFRFSKPGIERNDDLFMEY